MESLGLDGKLQSEVRWDLICKQSIKDERGRRKSFRVTQDMINKEVQSKNIYILFFLNIDRIDMDLLGLFDNKDNGNRITKKIGKDIKKRKQFKSKGRGKTKKSYFNHEKEDNIDDNKKNKEKEKDEDKKMDIDNK